MRKMRLELDSLHVETFETARPEAERGTVHARSGQSCTYNCTLDELTCGGPACRTVPVLTCLC